VGSDGVVKGIVNNPAAPPDVQLRLLADEASDVWDFLAWQSLPDEVIDAIVEHPDRRIRSAFAGNGIVPGEARARLVDDPDPGVRLALAAGPNWFRIESPALPDWAQLRLINDAHPRVSAEALDAPTTSLSVLASLAGDEDPRKRRAACRAWESLGSAMRGRLRVDSDESVRTAAARMASTQDRDASEAYLIATQGQPPWTRGRVLRRAMLHRSTAERLAREGSAAERAAVAANPNVPLEIVRPLADDPEHAVRLMIASRPDLSERERAAIDYHIAPEDRLDPLPWVLEATDPELLRDCARSANILIRRSAAYNKHLPQDAIELLSADEDFPVRILLCENQPSVDGEVVLDTFLRWDSVVSAALQNHPNFPRDQLARRFTDDPDAHKRWLIYQDPNAPAEAVLRLSHDPDVGVRRSIATHRNLPLARLLELVEDPDVRTVERAAANPGLPTDVMHRLLDAAGIPRRD
jgi:hypothetical protein